MRRVILALVVLLASPAWAGYYATVTVRGSSASIFSAPGVSSGCFLTPSMAIMSLAGTYSGYLMVNVLDTSGNWSGYSSYAGAPSSTNVWSGTYSTCSANPAVIGFPTFIGGISDPALSSGSVLTGTGGSSGTTSTSSAETQALTSAVNALATQVSNTPKSADIQALSTSVNAMQQQVAAIENDQFNYTQASAIFAFFCGMPMLLWFVAKNVGLLLAFFRSI